MEWNGNKVDSFHLRIAFCPTLDPIAYAGNDYFAMGQPEPSLDYLALSTFLEKSVIGDVQHLDQLCTTMIGLATKHEFDPDLISIYKST